MFRYVDSNQQELVSLDTNWNFLRIKKDSVFYCAKL